MTRSSEGLLDENKSIHANYVCGFILIFEGLKKKDYYTRQTYIIEFLIIFNRKPY